MNITDNFYVNELLDADPRRVLRTLLEVYGVGQISLLVREVSDDMEPTHKIQWACDPDPDGCSMCWRGDPGNYVIEWFSQADGAEYAISRTLPDGTSLHLGEAVSLYEAKFVAAQDAGLDEELRADIRDAWNGMEEPHG